MVAVLDMKKNVPDLRIFGGINGKPAAFDIAVLIVSAKRDIVFVAEHSADSCSCCMQA